jgi:hypothetical protein
MIFTPTGGDMTRNRLALADGRDPWEQQPHETVKQYARFSFYRDYGRLRTLTQLHKLLTETGDKIKYDTLRQLSYENRWTERSDCWDVAQESVDRERLIAEHRDMVRRHRSVAGALLSKAIQALNKITVAEMTPADVVRYIKLATDLERIAVGEPQRIVAVTGPSGGPIQTEDITQLTAEERRSRLAEIAAELGRRAGNDPDENE